MVGAGCDLFLPSSERKAMEHAHCNGDGGPPCSGTANGGSDQLEPMKYIVVTGGVVSGLGKGVTISSIGRMLKNCGLRTTSIKIDPYLVSYGAVEKVERCFFFADNFKFYRRTVGVCPSLRIRLAFALLRGSDSTCSTPHVQ